MNSYPDRCPVIHGAIFCDEQMGAPWLRHLAFCLAEAQPVKGRWLSVREHRDVLDAALALVGEALRDGQAVTLPHVGTLTPCRHNGEAAVIFDPATEVIAPRHRRRSDGRQWNDIADARKAGGRHD